MLRLQGLTALTLPSPRLRRRRLRILLCRALSFWGRSRTGTVTPRSGASAWNPGFHEPPFSLRFTAYEKLMVYYTEDGEKSQRQAGCGACPFTHFIRRRGRVLRLPPAITPAGADLCACLFSQLCRTSGRQAGTGPCIKARNGTPPGRRQETEPQRPGRLKRRPSGQNTARRSIRPARETARNSGGQAAAGPRRKWPAKKVCIFGKFSHGMPCRQPDKMVYWFRIGSW